MDFEFDPGKSAANRAKHGMDFTEAQALWKDPLAIEIPARVEDEPRYMVIARRDQTLWAVVITYRQGRIRIISVRRARREEGALYEGQDL